MVKFIQRSGVLSVAHVEAVNGKLANLPGFGPALQGGQKEQPEGL